MFQEAYYRLQKESSPQQPWGLRQGCLKMLILPLLIYLIHAIVIVPPNLQNQATWRARGGPNYTFMVSKSGRVPVEIETARRVTVKQNQVVVANDPDSNNRVAMADIETVDALFNDAYRCALLFPAILCTYNYHPFYGYPTEQTHYCSIVFSCFTKTVMDDLQILAP